MKKRKNMANESSARNIIGQGTRIIGEVELNGDFRIDGHITGTVKSTGKIVVGASGEVIGDIFCQNADISGHINGKVTVNELISLKSSANFEGELLTSRIAIEVGAKFNGKCEMIDAATKSDE